MLSFWIMVGALALLVVAVLLRAVLASTTDRDTQAASDVAVYRAQLAEVEKEAARGLIPAAEAEAARTEVARRLLAADAEMKLNKAQAGPPATFALIAVLICVIGAGGLYIWLGAPGYGDLPRSDRIALAEERRKTRPNQAKAQERLPAAMQPRNLEAQYVELVGKLRETVAKRPDDLQGHVLLASSEANTGNFAAAAKAQERVIELRRGDVRGDDYVQLGEYLVLAAGGYVSPEAEAMFARALSKDQRNGGAEYYYGLMFLQTGRPDRAFRLWERLLREGPADAPWIAPIRGQIQQVAQLAGERFTLPPLSQRGPTQEDIDAAKDLSAQERMEMIRGMVAGLSDRLATEGGPPQDWARLIASLGILGETQQAGAIYKNAQQVFGNDPGAMALIKSAAHQAGLLE